MDHIEYNEKYGAVEPRETPNYYEPQDTICARRIALGDRLVGCKHPVDKRGGGLFCTAHEAQCCFESAIDALNDGELGDAEQAIQDFMRVDGLEWLAKEVAA